MVSRVPRLPKRLSKTPFIHTFVARILGLRTTTSACRKIASRTTLRLVTFCIFPTLFLSATQAHPILFGGLGYASWCCFFRFLTFETDGLDRFVLAAAKEIFLFLLLALVAFSDISLCNTSETQVFTATVPKFVFSRSMLLCILREVGQRQQSAL